ncbi:hypothetical protein MKQ70_15685 [Chitinophaga sedimenti]|uniref:hypothetical protein n=1 Tax=Chitinophaga sedimenti TaxID=2033606 RepID=UPI0020053434|nr:hypothetical protein [Chitinophaga sedimenti]MCK7556376.1 hypothetical protein [Chitinophaga sedimenti]
MLNEEFLHRALDKRREEQSFRQLAIAQNGVDFCSNDYLGLARTADVFTLAQEETEDRAYWHGSGDRGCSRGITSI